jgi:signal transduction histidine kinase
LTALELLGLINLVLFIGLFIASLWRGMRLPSRTSLDTILLFGSVALTVTFSRLAGALGINGQPVVGGITIALLAVAPLAMVRLVDDFRGQPRWISVTSALAFAATVVLGFAFGSTNVTLVEIALLAQFSIAGGYAAVAFTRESRRSRGITRRRMALVAIGAGLFVAAIVVVLVGELVPPAGTVFGILAQVTALGSAIALWLGFVPPPWVRRALREPDLRRFLDRSIRLTGIADDREAIAELGAAAADAFGASGAGIGLADPDRPVLRYVTRVDGSWVEYPSDAFIAGQAFTQGRSFVVADALHLDPEHADTYQRSDATVVLATPIQGEERRIGVLFVYAGREPIFADDDIALLELMADQLAVLLDARTLARQSAELRARENTARLKEEFLSSAAHDLRSPLTVVLGQAELLERRVARAPDQPVDAAGVARMAREARRLRDLVNDLLDAQRLEQGALAISRTTTDIGEIVEEIRTREEEEGRPVLVERPARPLVGFVDRARILQVVANLVENARKYGADGAHPRILVEREDGSIRITVADQGIGIPESERELIFDRFYRASNAQRVTDTGLGLGLYICRRIVEEHGGRIWHEPTPGGGSTFVVMLPLTEPATRPDVVAAADAAGSTAAAAMPSTVPQAAMPEPADA